MSRHQSLEELQERSKKDQAEGYPQRFEVGDIVIIDKDFGEDIGGMVTEVLKIKPASHCSSGWLIKVPLYKSWLDSYWFIKK